jgi:hypothetical protein
MKRDFMPVERFVSESHRSREQNPEKETERSDKNLLHFADGVSLFHT